jgi:hypothetical protein
LVPALVIAQQLPPNNTFGPNQLLRANDLEQMRDALENALGRINALESRSIDKCRFVSSPACTGLSCEATCSANERVKGGGCDGSGDVFVRESQPNQAQTGWICESFQPVQRAFALCCPT